MRFEDRMLNDLALTPKVFIINVDPFFMEYQSVPAELASWKNPLGAIHYVSRKASSSMYWLLCRF